MMIALLLVALLALAATLAGQFARQSLYPWLKPLPLPALIAMVTLTPAVPAKPMLLLALLAGWIGDVALLFRRGFMAGLLAFLCGHLAMAAALWQLGAELSPALLAMALLCASVMAYALQLPTRLLQVAVLSYALVLTLVAVLALPFALTLATPWPLALAALLFLLSDSLLGWNKFRRPLPHAQLWILGSYFSAQLLFVWAFLSTLA